MLFFIYSQTNPKPMIEKPNTMPACPRCEELAEAAKTSRQAQILTKAARSRSAQQADDGSVQPLDSAYLQKLLADLPPAQGELADEKEYLARLNACTTCPDLKTNVLCGWCGCYVALRARPKNASCPHPAGNRWQFL